MSVIHDMTQKAAHWHEPPKVSIYAENHAEKLCCTKCGQQYISRGKYDPGICRDCEAKQNAVCIDGPLNGEKAYDDQ